MCREFSKCYDGVNICFWTDGSVLTQSEAQKACQQINNSFLPRITDSSTQSKFEDFRTAAGDLLNNGGSWIDIIESNINNFHWIDGSQTTGWFVATYARVPIICELRTIALSVTHSVSHLTFIPCLV